MTPWCWRTPDLAASRGFPMPGSGPGRSDAKGQPFDGPIPWGVVPGVVAVGAPKASDQNHDEGTESENQHRGSCDHDVHLLSVRNPDVSPVTQSDDGEGLLVAIIWSRSGIDAQSSTEWSNGSTGYPQIHPHLGVTPRDICGTPGELHTNGEDPGALSLPGLLCYRTGVSPGAA